MSKINISLIDNQITEYVKTAKQYLEKGKFDHALALLFRALSLAEVLGDKKRLYQVKTLIVRAHHHQTLPDTAIEWCDLTLQDADEAEERAAIIELKVLNLMKKGQFKQAETLILELEKSPNLGIRRNATIQHGLLNVFFFRYFKHLTLDKAEEYFKKARKMLKEDDDFRTSIQLDYCVGLYLIEEGLFYYAKEKLLSVLSKTVDKVPQIYLYNELGQVLTKLMEYETAFEYLDKARDLAMEISYAPGLTMNVYYRGILHAEYFQQVEHAYVHFLTALIDFQKRKQYPEVSVIFYRLYELYLPVNAEKAEKYLKEYRNYLNMLDLEDEHAVGLEDVHTEEMYQWMNS